MQDCGSKTKCKTRCKTKCKTGEDTSRLLRPIFRTTRFRLFLASNYIYSARDQRNDDEEKNLNSHLANPARNLVEFSLAIAGKF